ncbi:ketopantoate reductase family protein [Halomonas sp. PR-M31]|uniref:ketopantoate reductase family protein n=1 Tax=Halomonas sp. PR-M31 TaxID=1471202 RepID=UPI00065197FB|nr:2-dehydropantoate 2-reductase [Halomonas sp. PR-M31]
MTETTLVLGPGALGRLLVAYLGQPYLEQQNRIELVGRKASSCPISLVTPEGETLSCLVPRIIANQAPWKPALVHLTTKAYAAEQALAELATHIDPATPLVLWQNGFQVQEPLTRRWQGPVLCATTTEGAYTQGEDIVVHAGLGHTFIGHLGGAYPDLADSVAKMLGRAGLSAESCTDIRQRLWHKLVVNAAINPLVARYRIRNGQLRDRPFRPMVTGIIDELSLIMEAESIAPPKQGWAAMVWKVIEGTANNRASMLQDVLAGRPTEADAILGPLREAARRHDIVAPRLDALWDNSP